MTDKSIDIVCDTFSSVGKYALTAIPFGIVMSPDGIPSWVYAVVITFGFVCIGVSVIIRENTDKNASEKNTINADIRKGVFHIKNAEINSHLQQ